jgi:uncharacterized protein involved in cysteine biosynthesis
MRQNQYRHKQFDRQHPRRRRSARARKEQHWTSMLFGAAMLAFVVVFNLVGISVPSVFGLPAMAYYPKCDTARLAGAAPIAEGAPGYRSELDDDADGLACEPYLGPR